MSRADLRPQLAGDQVPQRVRGEVADQPGRPVDVLQHAVGVVGHRRSPGSAPSARSTPAAARPPAAGPRSAPARARSAARCAGRRSPRRPPPGSATAATLLTARNSASASSAPPGVANAGGDPRRQHLGERPAAADHVLPQPALGLVQPERLAVAERRAAQAIGRPPPRTARGRTRASRRTGWRRSTPPPSGW